MAKSKNTPAVPDSARKRVDDLLLDGEALVLITQPARRRIMRDTLLLMPLSVAGCAGTALLLLGLINAGSTATAPNNNLHLFFIPFLIIIGVLSLILLTSPIWAYRNAHHYIYAITTRRAIILEPLPYFREAVRSYGKRHITRMRVKKSGNGSGDLYFATRSFASSMIQIGFLGIRDVEAVFQVMLETFEFNEDDFWSN